MMNIYNGTVTTDANGEAEVTMPDWFRGAQTATSATNSPASAHSPGRWWPKRSAAITFKIKTSLPQVKISWQVTGIRQDAWAQQNRIPVEEVKPAKERGSYLHPTAFGQPEERSQEWVRHPEMMQRQKEVRAQAAAKSPKQ
jgi:hypothetical protein